MGRRLTGANRMKALIIVWMIVGCALGCGREKTTAESPTQSTSAFASANERDLVSKFGYAPQPNPRVTYQPDVLLLTDGPKIIRGVSEDGFTWTLDRNGRGVENLKVGSIMFATSRAVGRVIDIRPRGTTVDVTVLPVQITEIIRDANLVINQPLSAASLGPQSYLARSEDNDDDFGIPENVPSRVLASSRSAAMANGFLLANLPSHKESGKVAYGDWEIEAYFRGVNKEETTGTPAIGSSAIEKGTEFGFRLSRAISAQKDIFKPRRVPLEYERSPMVITGALKPAKLGASVSFVGSHISLRCNLVIANGVFDKESSSFVIEGLERLKIGFAAGTDEKGAAARFRALEIPLELGMSVPVYGVPMVFLLKAKVYVELTLVGRDSTLWASGQYKLGGNAIGYEHGTIHEPTLEVEKSLVESIGGISLGGSGIVVAGEFRFFAGFGTKGLAAFGGYYKLIVSAGVAAGSALALPFANCSGVTLKIDGGPGAGLSFGTDLFYRLDALQSRLAPRTWQHYPFFELAKKESKLEFDLFESTSTLWCRSVIRPNVPICGGGELPKCEPLLSRDKK
jgi:hypothetical protein